MTKRLSVADILSPAPPAFIQPKEIRLLWMIEGREGMDGMPAYSGLWHPDTPEHRRALQQVMRAGNVAYGQGTHWIEEREA